MLCMFAQAAGKVPAHEACQQYIPRAKSCQHAVQVRRKQQGCGPSALVNLLLLRSRRFKFDMVAQLAGRAPVRVLCERSRMLSAVSCVTSLGNVPAQHRLKSSHILFKTHSRHLSNLLHDVHSLSAFNICRNLYIL